MHLFVRLLQQLSTNTQLQIKLTQLLLTSGSVLPFYMRTPTVYSTVKFLVIAFSRTLSQPLVYVHSYILIPLWRFSFLPFRGLYRGRLHSHTSLSLMLLVVGLGFRYIYYCVLCTHCLCCFRLRYICVTHLSHTHTDHCHCWFTYK